MCQIGLTLEAQGHRVMWQPCLTAEHRIFSRWLLDSVPLSAWESLLMGVHWASPSRLTVGGDVSTSVTLTLSRTG